MAQQTQFGGRAKLRGLLRTGYVYSEAGPAPGQLVTPIFLTLSDPIDVSPASEGSGHWVCGHTAVAEVHVVPMAPNGSPSNYPDFDDYVGSIVEIAGEILPGFNRHHFRPVLITCEPQDISIISPFGLSTIPGSKILRRGSGIVINTQGHILTAEHVVHGQAYSVRRGLARGEAQVVAVHPELDVAILQCDLFSATNVPLRHVLPPLLGEVVFACGYPLRPFLGHSLSITSGIVSATETTRGKSVWISAPVQKGNSGGPVFDEFGNLLALVNNRLSTERLLQLLETKKLERDAQDGLQLMNFAVPVFWIASFLRDRGIPYDPCDYVEDIPSNGQPLRATKIAERARRICVEVECWEAV